MTRPSIEHDSGRREREPELIWQEGTHRVVVTFNNGVRVHLEKKGSPDMLGNEKWDLVKIPYDIVPECFFRKFAELVSGDEDLLK